jgi:kinesin family protein 3/17
VGKKNRSVGATLMNQDSSRSHSIFTITIETIDQEAQSASGSPLEAAAAATAAAAAAAAA